MSFIANDILANSKAVESSAADNATATASVAAESSFPAGLGQANHITGFAANYSAAPSAGYKTITFKKDATTLFTLRHDFANAGNILPSALPTPVHGDLGGAVSIELQASGTGGVTGTVLMFYAKV